MLLKHNRVITRKILFRLSLQKILQVSKLYMIFGAISRLLKDPTVPRYCANLTGIVIKYEDLKPLELLTYIQ